MADSISRNVQIDLRDVLFPPQLTGSGKMQYGRAKNCDATDGEMNVKFEHSTTQEVTIKKTY